MVNIETGQVKSGIGLGLSFVLSSQIYPFMLSSAFTARTIVKEHNEEDSVKRDMWIAFALSTAASIALGYYMHDTTTMIGGTAFALVLLGVYEWRGELMAL